MTIDTYITPVLGKIHWGYDLPMYVCGTKHSHVDNVYHLGKPSTVQQMKCTIWIEVLTPQQRTRYGTGYSKTDFSALDGIYENYKKGYK